MKESNCFVFDYINERNSHFFVTTFVYRNIPTETFAIFILKYLHKVRTFVIQKSFWSER